MSKKPLTWDEMDAVVGEDVFYRASESAIPAYRAQIEAAARADERAKTLREVENELLAVGLMGVAAIQEFSDRLRRETAKDGGRSA